MTSTASSNNIKTDEKKQHFDDIYVQKTPVPYKTEILDKLEYVSDDFNRQMFDRLILPWIQKQQKVDTTKCINFVDLCSCFGNTTMATVYGMSYEDIKHNWRDETSCQTIAGQRRFNAHITGADISENAMAYGKSVGLYDEAIVVDLNAKTGPPHDAVLAAMKNADVFISTAALVYLDVGTIQDLVSAFANSNTTDKKEEGYVLVNFLNPFSLQKADETKRILLRHLDFVGSMATRHRKMSQLEQDNYPGEEWALLELWVLKRRQTS